MRKSKLKARIEALEKHVPGPSSPLQEEYDHLWTLTLEAVYEGREVPADVSARLDEISPIVFPAVASSLKKAYG